MTRSRKRPSIVRSISASTSSTPPTCTASAATRNWSAGWCAIGASGSWSRPSSATCAAPTEASKGINGRPDYVRQACDASLQRTGLGRHRPLLPAPRRSERADRGDGRRDGRARPGGQGASISAYPRQAPDTIRRAHAVHPISAVQIEYSLWSRDPEEAILPLVRELGIGFVPYSPLGRGFLTGQFRSPDDIPADDLSPQHPRFQGEAFAKNLDLVKEVEVMAQEKGCTPAQLALAWVLAQGRDIVPIPGTKRRKYLTRIWVRWTWFCPTTISRGSTTSCPRARRRAQL